MINHTCHFPTCNALVPPRLFMCKLHWSCISKETRTKILNAYNNLTHDDIGRLTEISEEYLKATKAGIEEVKGFIIRFAYDQPLP